MGALLGGDNALDANNPGGVTLDRADTLGGVITQVMQLVNAILNGTDAQVSISPSPSWYLRTLESRWPCSGQHLGSLHCPKAAAQGSLWAYMAMAKDADWSALPEGTDL